MKVYKIVDRHPALQGITTTNLAHDRPTNFHGNASMHTLFYCCRKFTCRIMEKNFFNQDSASLIYIYFFFVLSKTSAAHRTDFNRIKTDFNRKI